MIRLYQHPLSPYCHRVRIVLAEKELDYQTVNIDISKGENQTEQFLRYNPLGKVPVLADDDLILAESLVINEYLNDEYPYPELMPEGSQEKALVRHFSIQIDRMISDSFHDLHLAERAKEKGESFDTARLEQGKKNIFKFLEIADKQLRGKEYLCGVYSLADIAFAPYIGGFEMYQIDVPENLTEVNRWLKRLSKKNTVVKTK